jgi:LysM repeat protein
MKQPFYILSLVVFLLSSCISNKYISGENAPNSGDYGEYYVKTYYPKAVEQMNKHGIPASITLAQALLEGGAGRSDLVREANNHFGVKADKRWNGKTYSKWDNGKWCKFRVYNSAEESFEDHSKFLLSNSRYDFLFGLRKDDYKGWAKGLKKAGYAEDPQYPTKLINLIERYGLHKYDSYTKQDIKKNNSVVVSGVVVAGDTEEKNLSGNHELLKTNGLIHTIAVEGDTFEGLSSEFDISKRKLRRYNDLYKGYVFNAGDIIYLEKKNNKARRGTSFHTTQKGESLYSLSQKYGIKLKKLYNMNPMYKEYTNLKVGDVIRLR